MDLSVELRAKQRALTAAEDRLTAARSTEVGASRAYDARRRHSPAGAQTDRARQAWALALIEWTTALVEREKARDHVKAERRDVDDTAMNALMSSERPYEPTEDLL